MTVPWYVIGIIACIGGSAFFSAAEMAYSSCNKLRLESLKEEGNDRAETALYITEHFDDALSAILVGNNLVNIAASSLGSVLVLYFLGSSYAWVSTLVITIAVVIFGETIPKITAEKNANRTALGFASVTRFLMLLFRPLTKIVVKLAEVITGPMKGETTVDKDEVVDELHSIIETAENEEVLDEDESELVSAAIDFADVSVSEVMTARVDIVAVNVDDSWEEIMETIEHSSYSRIPVYEDSIDNVIGILSANHFLKESIDHHDFDLRTLLMKPYYVYKTMKLPSVLEMLRNSQQHLAVVTDEYGGTLGVVSLEDVLEELVGEIWDETDQVEDEIVEAEDNVYEIDGDTACSDLRELMGWDEVTFDFESETVGGWCIEMLDEFPEKGASFTFNGVKVTVEDTDERRVTRVRIEVLPQEEKETDEWKSKQEKQ